MFGLGRNSWSAPCRGRIASRSSDLVAAQCEVKGCAPVWFSFRPNPATMFLHDTMDGGQSHTRAFKVFVTVKALEDSEQFIGILHVEANAVVPHEEHLLAFVLSVSDLNDRVWPRARVLDCIGKQVLKHLPDQNRVAFQGRKTTDFPLHVAPCSFRRQ